MADFFTWVGRAAHGGHAVRTLSREGDAATVTRRRTDVPQWYQGAGMNGSDLEKIAMYANWCYFLLLIAVSSSWSSSMVGQRLE